MRDLLGPVFIAFLVGMLLGTCYFGGLWLTVKRLPDSKHPALLSLGSFIVRLGFCLLGFYWVMDGAWKGLLIALLGFLLMRGVLLRRWGKDGHHRHHA